ncbi:MAG: NfeD family protein [Phycisphaerales bacterium]|nr:NfeD family protein [Phycisphaerales bacterium]
MMLLGGDADGDLGADVDADALGEDSTDAFTLVSIQAVAALMMVFGWGGVAARLGFDFSFSSSVAIGALVGIGFVWLLAIMMKAIFDLQADGNIDIQQTIGLEGVVYTAIPAMGGGRGQVRLVIDERLRVYSAVSQDEAIASQASIRVVGVRGDNSVVVVPVD